MPEYEGTLEAYSETGTEGIIWALLKHTLPPEGGHGYYDRLVCLEPGDHLIIYDKESFYYDAEKVIVWEGDHDVETESHQETNDYGRTDQAIFNMWCHGLQKTPFVEQWALYFLREFPAKIVRKDK